MRNKQRKITRKKQRRRNSESSTSSAIGTILLELIAAAALLLIIFVSSTSHEHRTPHPSDAIAERTADFGAAVTGFVSDQLDQWKQPAP